MIIGNLVLGINSATVSYLVRYDSLLQSKTYIITKCDSYFIARFERSLLQNVSGFLLQNATFYYKMWQLLQNAMIITNCDSVQPRC